jgi:hypothetical protein
MKKFLSLTAICVAITLVALPLAYGQQGKAAPQVQKMFQGQLTNVDTAAKRISVKGAGDAEMWFQYSDQTEIVGPQKDIQGLASQTGTALRVTYREAGADNRIATKIEVLDKK